ncbi:hypothetical protein STRAU_6603 [Streptomyces aurantiacus JA 4570]|uniref:Uncharacterized protein n=1 Tax=Streptomyces aurantiacus JA 4570 TaxID=1286094 RepID=S3ZPP6_9ACTN|nr:hypothetical protein STRAU_6603 [Streptomyces aurantiacus JA 4570]
MMLRRYHQPAPGSDPDTASEPDQDAPQPPAAGRSSSRGKTATKRREG